MLFTISKIIYKSGKSYLLFIFLATFLSLFSYILSSNIISSVDTYLKEQTRPLLWWDLVLRGESDFDREYFTQTYWEDLLLAQTIETQTTLFDDSQRPNLVQLIYHDAWYPFYDSFSYDIVNESWSVIVDQVLIEKFGERISIFWEDYVVRWVISSSPLWDFSAFSLSSNIYIPIKYYDRNINETNSRIDTKYYWVFRGNYDPELITRLKNDQKFESFRISSLDDRNENIWEITDRLWLFINFFNLIVFVLTFFIIILSLETFYKKLKITLWILTILGLWKVKIFYYNIIFIALIFFLALALAVAMNYFALMYLSQVYDFLVFHPTSVTKWILISWVLLIIWVYSPFYKIYSSRISDMLSDNSSFSNFAFWNYLIYISLLFIWFYSISIISNISQTLAFFYSFWFISGIIILYVFSNSVLSFVYFLIKWFLKKKNFYIFDAIRSTIKPGNVSFFIVFSSFISFVSIFIFFVFSWSFITFLSNFTQSSNDSFIVDVSPDDIDRTRQYFTSDEIYTIVPMRISEINTVSLEEYTNQNTLSSRQFSREFLSTTRNLESDIIRGDSIRSGGVSVDEEFAGELWIDIWDEILFSIAGLEKKLQVVNIRKAIRSGATPFFYFALYENDFENFPKRYFVSYKSSDKPADIQFEYSQAVWWDVTYINAQEIIEIVLDVAQKVLLIIYFCLAYVTLFSFLTFFVSISFLRSFKTTKLQLMHVLWWEKNKLEWAVAGEYIYLIFFGLTLAVILGTLVLVIIQLYINFFSIDTLSYIQWLWLIAGILSIMSVFLMQQKKTLD